jgi:hypothetical protein
MQHLAITILKGHSWSSLLLIVYLCQPLPVIFKWGPGIFSSAVIFKDGQASSQVVVTFGRLLFLRVTEHIL